MHPCAADGSLPAWLVLQLQARAAIVTTLLIILQRHTIPSNPLITSGF